MCGLYLVWGSVWWYLRVVGWFQISFYWITVSLFKLDAVNNLLF